MDVAVPASFKDPDVVERISKHFKISSEQASNLFEDVKLFLAVAAQRKVDFTRGEAATPTLNIDDDLYMLDEAWHCFVLFTETYAQFCQTYFGQFIHHHPIRQADRDREHAEFTRDADAWRKHKKEVFEEEVRYCARFVSEATLRRWFLEKKYRK